MRCSETGIGGARAPRVIDPARGPVITSAVRVADALDGDGSSGRGFYVEDAGFPEFIAWMLQLRRPAARAAAVGAPAWRPSPTGCSTASPSRSARRSRACSATARCSNGVLPLLGMGRDVPDGRMTLDGDRLEVDWSKDAGSRAFFDRLRETSAELADRARAASSSTTRSGRCNRVITVHPLGGARMGRSDDEGVVDPYGRVFNLPGLHVADGSVMPGPIGPNPSLTIAAMADRFADAILERRAGRRRRPRRRADSAEGAPASSPAANGDGAVALAFTEEMKGFCDFSEPDYDRAYRVGREAGQDLMFHLTITTEDVERFIADREHEAVAVGWVQSGALGGRLPVERGQFNLFVDHDGRRDRKRMHYRLPFHDGARASRDARRLQGGRRRPRLRRLERHHHALHPRARRPRRARPSSPTPRSWPPAS